VDSSWLPRIIATAEAQLTSPPGFFFAAMPTSRTPQSAKAKKAAAAAGLKKTRAQTVAASGDATKGCETPAQTEEVGSVPGPSSGPGSSREAGPGGGGHTMSSSATGSQPPKPPEGGGDQGGGNAAVSKKGVTPSRGSAKSPTKRKSARKEGSDAPSPAKKTVSAPGPVVDQQRPAEVRRGGALGLR
jgi:hypothetical protein